MKKAYVKPVFMADEYELTASVAGCGPVSVTKGWQLVLGEQVCSAEHGGGNPHTFVDTNLVKSDSYDTGVTYWQYATYSNNDGNNDQRESDIYLFTTANNVCDFLWQDTSNMSGQSTIYVWDSIEKNGSTKSVGQSFMSFFCGPNANHNIGTVDEEIGPIAPFS